MPKSAFSRPRRGAEGVSIGGRDDGGPTRGRVLSSGAEDADSRIVCLRSFAPPRELGRIYLRVREVFAGQAATASGCPGGTSALRLSVVDPTSIMLESKCQVKLFGRTVVVDFWIRLLLSKCCESVPAWGVWTVRERSDENHCRSRIDHGIGKPADLGKVGK